MSAIIDVQEAPGASRLLARQAGTDPAKVPAVRPAGRDGVNALFAVGDLLVAAGLAVLLVAGIGWCSNHLERAWTTIGPDYTHTAQDAAENATCTVGAPTYSQWRCVLYLQDDAAREAYRVPVAQGGVCPLATRFDCARRYGLEQHDEDVPLWLPWYLHNGPAGTAFGAAGGALLALLVAGFVVLTGGARGTSWRRRSAAAGVAVAAGGLVGVAWYSLDRHTAAEYGVPTGAPWWVVPSLVLLVVLVMARRARSGGAR